MVTDLVPGPRGSAPASLINQGGWLYFRAESADGQCLLYVCDPDSCSVKPITDPQGNPILPRGAGLRALFSPENQTCYLVSFLLEDGKSPQEDPAAKNARLWRESGGKAVFEPVMDFSGFIREHMRDYCLLGEKNILMSCKGQVLVIDGHTGDAHEITIGKVPEGAWGIRNPRSFKSGALFVGNSLDTGAELWFTDGSQQGTRMLKDIASGPATSSITSLYQYGEYVLFAATDDVHGCELWQTDGTPEGTRLVKDINPGRASSDPHYLCRSGNFVYLAADDGVHGEELWRTDGTPQSTGMVMDVFEGSKGSAPWSLADADGLLYFCAESSKEGEEVHVTNGTAAGTRVLKPIVSGAAGSGPNNITPLNGLVFFTCNEPVYGEELWMSDGTAEGTRLVQDIYSSIPNPSSSPRELTPLCDRVCFVVADAKYGEEVWISDGTDPGTQLLRDLAPMDADARPRDLTAAGNKVFFVANDHVHGDELWSTDGTAEGTLLVRDICSGAAGSTPDRLAALNQGLYFMADDGCTGREPWFADPNTGTAVPLGDLTPGSDDSDLSGFFDVEGRAYAYVRDTPAAATLWLFGTDGTKATAVRRVPCPAPIWEPGSMPAGEMTAAAAGLFSSRDAVFVSLLHPIVTKPSRSAPVWADGIAYFSLYTDEYGAELWRSDGSLAQTRMVRDCNPGRLSSSPAQLCVHDAIVYFVAEDETNARVVWRSDGTTQGTHVVHPMNASETFESLAALELVLVDNTLMVVAPSMLSGRSYLDLASISLTTMNFNSRPYDLNPGVAQPRNLTPAGARLFFTTDDGIHGEELWVTYGQALENTALVKDIAAPVEQPALGFEGR